jgi:hypothetical protein
VTVDQNWICVNRNQNGIMDNIKSIATKQLSKIWFVVATCSISFVLLVLAQEITSTVDFVAACSGFLIDICLLHTGLLGEWLAYAMSTSAIGFIASKYLLKSTYRSLMDALAFFVINYISVLLSVIFLGIFAVLDPDVNATFFKLAAASVLSFGYFWMRGSLSDNITANSINSINPIATNNSQNKTGGFKSKVQRCLG